MSNLKIRDMMSHWQEVKEVLSVPRTEADYDRVVALLNELIDIVGEDETHPYTGLMETLATLIGVYDQKHFTLPKASGIEVLEYLMEEHGLKQTDLRAELGTQGVVSEILNGKRMLNTRQIRALSERFCVSPEAFI